MFMPFSRAVWAAALILGATLRLAGQAPAVNSTPVNLPEFNVVGERELPPPETWYYTKIAGQEVLSSASRARTAEIAGTLTRLLHALDLTGTPLLPRQKAKLRIVISGRPDEFLSLAPQVLESGEQDPESAALGGPENPLLVINAVARSLQTGPANEAPAEEEAADTGAPTVKAADAIRQLQIGYLRTVLSQQRPALPPWFIEGLSQVLAWVRITDSSVSLGFVEDPNLSGVIGGVNREAGRRAMTDVRHESTAVKDTLSADLDFNAALAHSALFSLEEMFSSDIGTFRGKENYEKRIRWQKQCHAFVHWGLFGDYGRHEKQFLAFMQRLQQEPLTDKLFQQSFGMGYAKALATLRTHIEMTRVKFVGVKVDKGEKLPPPPRPDVREATLLEVARLKSIVYTASGQPDKAREELILAYRRGERSPDLVAELGLADLAAGKRDQALRHLGIAVKEKSTRTRAYVALARMRLEDRSAKPQGKAGKLSYEQLLGVLEPLILARAQAPQMSDIYRLFADAWLQADVAPPPQHLALIDEGLTLFPQDEALRTARAQLGPKATTK